MADDQTFRLILAFGMAAFLPVALYHRIRSQAGGEKLDRRQEGLFILVTLRLSGLAAMGGLVAFMLDPVWMSWASVPLPAALRWVGVAFGVPTGRSASGRSAASAGTSPTPSSPDASTH